jgi:hypothetical protein
VDLCIIRGPVMGLEALNQRVAQAQLDDLAEMLDQALVVDPGI